MRRISTVFLIAIILFTLLFAAACSAQNRRDRFNQQPSFSIDVSEVPAGSPVKGVLVTSVAAGGLADAAGVKAGDIIIKLAGKPVESVTEMRIQQVLLARMMGIGQSTEMVVFRDGTPVTLTITPGSAVAQGAQDAQPTGPWLGINMKDAPKNWGIEGVLVSEVVVNAPADEAGIMVGDIVTDINGQPVKTVSDIQKTVSGLTTGKSYMITVRRGSQTLTSDVTIKNREASNTAPVKRRLSDFNVLKYAVIDPQTRVITLVGKYDPNYKTGSLPYYDLLNDAIRSPYPWFSLEPTNETISGVNRIIAAIEADVQRMYSESNYCNTWANRLMNLILNDPSLKRDRAQFIKKGAEAFQVTEEEMLKVLTKSANPSDSSISTDDIMSIIGKVLRGMGYEELGNALAIQGDGSQATFDRLGIGSESAVIVAKFKSGEITQGQAELELSTLLVSAMLRGLRVPEADITSRANNVLSGRMSAADFQKYLEERMMSIIVDGVGLKMFNGLTLSNQVLSKLYNVPTPQMNLVYKDVPADSLLGDILFRADYALKSICTSPEIRDRIPGFLTEMEYMRDSSAKKGTRVSGDAGAEIGHRLIPGDVKMRVSPSGDIVSFDDAQIKIIGWVDKTVGKQSPEVANAIKSSVEEYAGYLTQRYDDLAKVFPELHRIREAEKLIALARWAKANNYTIAVDRAAGIRLAQSPTAAGFWLAVFTADQQEFSLSVIAEGGAAFDKNEGEAWVQPTVNNEVTSDISKQLIVSTVLSQQAADAAINGDMEAARDLADKSARAMTGDIDLTQLPSLGDLPMPGEPAQTVILSNEAISAIDENLRQVENAKITMQKAADLEATSPQDAAQLREIADAQQQQANANIQKLRDALESVRNGSGKTNDAVVTIRGLGKVTPPSGTVATNPQPNPGPIVTPGGNTTPAAPQPPAKDDITPEQRKKWLAELASLKKELESTKLQFGKLSKSIQQDQTQFDDWEKVARDGMERCSGVLYNLLMDASAAQLSQRYETMEELAKKLPNKPQDLIDKMARIKNWFKAMSTTQAFKDVADVAAKDGKTLPELLEEVRDDLNIIASVTGLDKTIAFAAWKQGTNIVEMAYSFAQFSTAYDNIDQLDKNSDSYLKAVAALSARMKTIVTRINEIEGNLNIQQ